MRLSIVLAIVRKELTESLRDRRTIFMTVLVPLLLYPALILMMSRLQESNEEQQKARTSNVAIWGAVTPAFESQLASTKHFSLKMWQGAAPELRTALESNRFSAPTPERASRDSDQKPVDAKPVESEWLNAARKLILDRQTDAVLLVWPGFSERLAQGGLGTVTILYDSVRPDSKRASDRLKDELNIYRESLLATREQLKALDAGFTQGIDVHTTNVAPPQRRSGMVIGMMLPFMLIIFSVSSGFYPAVDVTAGEKERGTMQTLLCAPVHAIEIIAGKFLAVLSIALIACIVNLSSLGLTFSRIKMGSGAPMSLSPVQFLIAFAMLLPVLVAIIALFLAVGAFARDFKDGQSSLTPVLMLLIVPLTITMSPSIELDPWLCFVPIINIALLMKAVFVNEWKADQLFLVLLSSFGYAALALSFAARVFERNNILLGGKETVGGVLDFSRTPGSKPTPGVSVLLFVISLVMAFYGSLSLTHQSLPMQLLIVELGFFLLPAVALVQWKGYSMRDTFSMRVPHWRALLGCLLIGLSGWAVASLFIRLFPPPESLTKALERLVFLDDKPAPLWEAWLFIGLLPALCEETLFRGVVLSGFRRLGAAPAILLTALLFGFAHASIYRLLPTMFLGVLFGVVVWRTKSLAAGILCHMLNNGLAATMARSGDLMHRLGLSGLKFVPWHLTALAALVLLAGLALVWSAPQAQDDSPVEPESVTA